MLVLNILWLEQFTDQTKIAKKQPSDGIARSINDILKTVKHKYCHSSGTCHKYVVQFTDPTPTIFWYVKRAKLTILNMPVLHAIQ